MTLKQISLIIAFGLLFFSVVADCYASDSASGGIVHLHKISKTHRPNAPSNIDIPHILIMIFQQKILILRSRLQQRWLIQKHLRGLSRR